MKAGDTLWDDSQVAGHGQDVCHGGLQAALQLVEWKITKTKNTKPIPPLVTSVPNTNSIHRILTLRWIR